MNTAPTREEKLASFQQLTKLPGIKTAHQLAAASSNKARILIDHPHSYRDWTIVRKIRCPVSITCNRLSGWISSKRRYTRCASTRLNSRGSEMATDIRRMSKEELDEL